MQTMRAALLSLLFSSVLASSLVRAQDSSRITLFKTASEDEGLAELAAAVDPILQSALGENSTITIASQAAVDLPSLQLALGCVGETDDCLSAAANQSEAPSLLAPSVRRIEGGILVTFLHFDATQQQPIRTVERRYTGEGQGQAALTGVREMVAELFPVDAPAAPERTATEPAPDAALTGPPSASEAPAREPGLPILPIIIGGAGVALLGTGIVFGALSEASMDDYAAIKPSEARTRSEGRKLADEAHETFDRAETQGTIANVLFGVSAGVLVGAGVLFFWQMKERWSEAEVSVQPRVGPGTAGLALTGAWNGGL